MKNNKKNSRVFLVAVITIIVLTVTAAGLAWAVQSYGGAPWAVGRWREITLDSGNYTTGIDLPPGEYSVSLVDGNGKLFHASQGGQTEIELSGGSAEAAKLAIAADDIITLNGIKLKLQCKNIQGTVTPRSGSDGKVIPVTAADAGDGYVIGRDIPAGVFSVKAAAGSGRVTSGTSAGGIDVDMDSEGLTGVIEFYHVELFDGDVLLLDGVDIIMVRE